MTRCPTYPVNLQYIQPPPPKAITWMPHLPTPSAACKSQTHYSSFQSHSPPLLQATAHPAPPAVPQPHLPQVQDPCQTQEPVLPVISPLLNYSTLFTNPSNVRDYCRNL
ncbi:hypothetical protein KIL84_007333 [Mauremys mutica]|uniref:Uncharacterized protein n=1 Tax=Mauremys mutica TaxID=74926 RepID=A0A9D3X2V9_9SAUR|nr:hypothetical protein KIL84_007333 [Mauremys mutica]